MRTSDPRCESRLRLLRDEAGAARLVGIESGRATSVKAGERFSSASTVPVRAARQLLDLRRESAAHAGGAR